MNRIRKVLIAVLAVVFVIGVGGMVWSHVGYQQGKQDYSDAEELAGLPQQEVESPSESEEGEELEEDPNITAMLAMDLAALQEVNSEVIGWIQIPGTELSYPLMQTEDNSYYLDYTWEKKRNPVGAIFMDYRNDRDLSDFNTIIYGHNMNNGSMFGHLHKFKEESFLEEHPYIYLLDESGCHRYEIFGVYEVSVSTAESYQLSFEGNEDKQAFIDACLALSDISTEVEPTIEDHIITLSTCTGRGYSTRWVVQAVLEKSVN